MAKRWMQMLLIVGGLFLLLFGFNAFKNFMMRKYLFAEPPPVTVSSMKAETTDWPQTLMAIGSLRAIDGVDISPELAGLIDSLHARSGQVVAKGDLLVQLNVAQEKAQLQVLEAQLTLDEINYKRNKAQYEIKAISKAQLDENVASLRSTRASIKEQKAIIDKKTIRAPFSGKLGINPYSVGKYVNPGEAIVSLQSVDPILVDFYLPQQNVPKLSVGQQVQISLDGLSQAFTGEITALNSRVDSATRNIAIEAKVANPQHLLLPGMFVNVKVTVGRPETYVTLPQSAISFNPYGEIVYLVDQDEKSRQIANQRFVKVGPKRGDQIAIVEGISEGEEVVTSGQLKLRNGSRITINNTLVPSNDPNPQVADE